MARATPRRGSRCAQSTKGEFANPTARADRSSCSVLRILMGSTSTQVPARGAACSRLARYGFANSPVASGFGTNLSISASIMRPAVMAADAGLNGAKPAAIKSALMKCAKPASFGKNDVAKVVLPAPFGPAITLIAQCNTAHRPANFPRSALSSWLSRSTCSASSTSTSITASMLPIDSYSRMRFR
jgi:hypothetical protein